MTIYMCRKENRQYLVYRKHMLRLMHDTLCQDMHHELY